MRKFLSLPVKTECRIGSLFKRTEIFFKCNYVHISKAWRHKETPGVGDERSGCESERERGRERKKCYGCDHVSDVDNIPTVYLTGYFYCFCTNVYVWLKRKFFSVYVVNIVNLSRGLIVLLCCWWW